MKSDVKILLDELITITTSKNSNVLSRFKHKNIWNYEHDYDFIYGQKIGFIVGAITFYYIGKYKTNPTVDELLEIKNEIVKNIDKIKNNVEI